MPRYTLTLREDEDGPEIKTWEIEWHSDGSVSIQLDGKYGWPLWSTARPGVGRLMRPAALKLAHQVAAAARSDAEESVPCLKCGEPGPRHLPCGRCAWNEKLAKRTIAKTCCKEAQALDLQALQHKHDVTDAQEGD